MKPSLRNLNLAELEDLAVSLGEKSYRGRQLSQWLFKKSLETFDQVTDLPALFLENLGKEYLINSLTLASRNISKEDRSVKYLFKTQDGHLIETVLILQEKRRTICLSTQVGCKMGCRFCASGQEGFLRHLSCGEILDQIAWVKKDQKNPPTNLVYMGMGEPLDNYDAVIKSIRTSNAPWGFEIGQRRITVSTVGIVPGIQRLAQEDLGQIKLCFSLHSPDNAIRTKLIPSNRKYGLEEIVQTLKEVRPQFKRDITMEYILIEGMTDRESDAEKLVKICKLLRAKVNLIPYNRIGDVDFKRPSLSRIKSFQQFLERANVSTTVRYSAGQDIDAACGQLRLVEERKARKSSPPSSAN